MNSLDISQVMLLLLQRKVTPVEVEKIVSDLVAEKEKLARIDELQKYHERYDMTPSAERYYQKRISVLMEEQYQEDVTKSHLMS